MWFTTNCLWESTCNWQAALMKLVVTRGGDHVPQDVTVEKVKKRVFSKFYEHARDENGNSLAGESMSNYVGH